ASGPFRIVMLSMSCGLMSAPLFVKSVEWLSSDVAEFAEEAKPAVLKVLLLIGNPSTTYSGWLLPLSELTPRIMIEDEEPGKPEVVVTSTPATRPARPFTKFSRCVWATVDPLTSVTA